MHFPDAHLSGMLDNVDRRCDGRQIAGMTPELLGFRFALAREFDEKNTRL
jgi:hypothetical protein